MAPKVTARKRQVVLSGARPAASPGRPRPWKSSDAAAAARDFFARSPTTERRRTAIRELIGELCSGDPFDHRCAAEVARLISRREPGVLAGYGDLLAEVAATLPMEEWQARGYVLVAAAHNAVTGPQRRRLLPLVRARLDEDRIAVRAMALEAFAILAARTPELRDEALERLEAARHSGDFAMRARARLMLPVATGRAVQADAAQRAKAHPAKRRCAAKPATSSSFRLSIVPAPTGKATRFQVAFDFEPGRLAAVLSSVLSALVSPP